MRRAWLAASTTLLVVACATPLPQVARGDGASLRVMTYNIFAGNDLERRSNLERIAALIDSLEVDIVLLQEVDRGTVRSGRVDQPAVLAQHTGMAVVFGRSMNYGGGEFGNAILSRWPVQHSQVVALQDSAARAVGDSTARSREPRSVLHVVIAAPAGAVHVLDTHVDQGADPTTRNAQLLELLAYAAAAVPRDARVVFGGDLNMRPDAPAARALTLFFRDAWTECGSGDGHTFRSDNPDRRIDYILLARLQCTHAWVPATQLSDHRPLVVDVRVAR